MKTKTKYVIVKLNKTTGNYEKMIGKGGLIGGFNSFKNAASMLNGYLKKYYSHNKYKIMMTSNYKEVN